MIGTKLSAGSASRVFAPLLIGLSLTGCVGSPYSGPVEVTRFVSQESAQLGERTGVGLGQGPITITFPEEMSNVRAKDAFYDAVASQLVALGYSIADESVPSAAQARVATSRSQIAPAASRSSPVSVGVGGSAGSFGSGLGLGVGINLGGNASRPTALSQLSVRISDAQGNSLWEGRAQQAISINSPYADVDASARALAAALFTDFPGGNGETVEIDVDELSLGLQE